MIVEDLRSPYVKTGGMYYFARMIDKIRLHTAGRLPADYIPNLGLGFDGRACAFLKTDYKALVAETNTGKSDAELLAWAQAQGGWTPDEEAIEVWNEFMRKRGWNDDGTETLVKRKVAGGFADRNDVQTFFDFLEVDEGREPRGHLGSAA